MSFALLALAAGCQPKATFDVTVINQTRGPVTVGLVKDGPPDEEAFADISRMAVESDLASLPPWGFVIPPGRTADIGNITGAFPAGTHAYLRVYRGQHSNAGLIATSADSPDRRDLLLFPGRTGIILRDPAGRLEAETVRPPQPR